MFELPRGRKLRTEQTNLIKDGKSFLSIWSKRKKNRRYQSTHPKTKKEKYQTTL